MSITDRVRGAVAGRPPAEPAERVTDRLDALRRFLQATDDLLPAERLAEARSVVDRVGDRLGLSREHSVVALAGATGSGKSSLFNALTRLDLSPVGVRRPTTGVAHACVWGSDRAGELLDWVGVPATRRFIRESPLDGDDERDLRGLVLLDLPDFDSVDQEHRAESDRLLSLVDLVIWVLDPQKYADRVVHARYLSRLGRYRDVTVVVLNQSDKLSPADTDRCLHDLRRLLVADGLPGVTVVATSAVDRPGLRPLRDLLQEAVKSRRAMLRRLAGDVDTLIDDLAPLVATDAVEDDVDHDTVRELTAALAAAAGLQLVVVATRQSYRHRAVTATGWPLSRWLRRLRPDPLRRLRLEPSRRQPTDPPTLPAATPAERAAVGLALRTLGHRAGAALPEPWRPAVRAAARSRADDLPDALDLALTGTDLGVARYPLWWRAVGGLQWVAAAAALAGLAWLAVRYVFIALALPEPPGLHVGRLPLATVALIGGLLTGMLISTTVRPLIGIGAARAQARAETRLRRAVEEVALDLCVAPVRGVLRAYDGARSALRAAAGR
ncbi:MAG: hypothetical protein QOI74_1553 [Micromonosporaceae bacterium]|nr:hypothetical protein [Micromonosporaceae bacterium]